MGLFFIEILELNGLVVIENLLNKHSNTHFLTRAQSNLPNTIVSVTCEAKIFGAATDCWSQASPVFVLVVWIILVQSAAS